MATSGFYKNNPNLPKAHTEKEFSPSHVAELAKCVNDPLYFGDNYFQVVHQDHGLIQMKLYDYQKEALEKFEKSDRLVMVTARQSGKTSLATVVLLHAALFNKRKNIVILANRKSTAKEVLSRIKTAYENLPDFLKGGVKEWNKESVEFENGSKIFADASEGNSIRGQSIFLLYIDECAFVENWDDFSSSVMPTVTANKTSRIMMTSTPNGINHFHDYCMNAKNGTNGFEYVEVPWWKVTGRDEAWRERTLAEMNFNLQKFEQEQCCEFLGSSGTLISGATLKLLKTATPYKSDTLLHTYKTRQENHVYVMIVDTSRGKGLDYSAFSLIDVTKVPYEQVVTYRNNLITPSDYAALIERVALHYNESHILIELNDLGSQVADLLWDFHEYENILMTESHKGKKRISSGFARNPDKGVVTSKSTKSLGCSMIKEIVESNQLLIHDKETINELKTFSAKGTSFEAETGKHDDLVMGLVLFGWLASQDYFKAITDDDIMQHLRETTEESFDDMLLPFGIINDGSEAGDGYVEEISYDQFGNWFNS